MKIKTLKSILSKISFYDKMEAFLSSFNDLACTMKLMSCKEGRQSFPKKNFLSGNKLSYPRWNSQSLIFLKKSTSKVQNQRKNENLHFFVCCEQARKKLKPTLHACMHLFVPLPTNHQILFQNMTNRLCFRFHRTRQYVCKQPQQYPANKHTLSIKNLQQNKIGNKIVLLAKYCTDITFQFKSNTDHSNLFLSSFF